MEWHVDDVLFDPPQVEVVFTLENTSDCRTMWKLPDGSIRTVETEKNSAILLAAGGAEHCVSSLKNGKRVILKCMFVHQDAIPVVGKEGMPDQFAPAASRRKQISRRRKKRKKRNM